MRIHTTDQLSDILSKDLSWRKKELSELKSMIMSFKNHQPKLMALFRSAIALLYAHFEGFIKKAGVSYLEFIRMQRLNFSELSDVFFTIALKQKFNVNYSSKKYSDFINVSTFIRNDLSSTANFNHKVVIDTESNLSSVVFKEIVLSLGLNYTVFEGLEKFLDTKLLKKRNYVAHGEFIDIDMDDYFLLHERIIEIMNNFKTQIENAVILNEFRSAHLNS